MHESWNVKQIWLYEDRLLTEEGTMKASLKMLAEKAFESRLDAFKNFKSVTFNNEACNI